MKILQSGTSADLQRHLPAILQIFEPAGLEENLTVGQARERVNQYINGGSNFLRYRQDNFSDDPTVLGRKTGLDNEETKLEAIRNVARDDLLRVELAGNGIWLLPPAIQPWPEDKKVVLRSAYELKEVRPLEELLLMDNNLPLVLRTGRPFFAWVRGQKGVKAVGFYRLNSEPYNARFLYYVPVSEFRNDPVAAARYLLRALHAIDPSVYRARKIELRRGALWAPGVLGDALLIRPTAAGLETTVEAEALRMEKQFILGKRLNPAEVLRVLRAYYEEVFGSAVGGKKVWGQGAFEAFLRESADQYKDPNELWKKVFLRVKRAEAEKSEEAVRRIFEESFKVGNQRWTDTGVIAVIQLADEKNRQQGKRIYHLYAGDLKKNRRGRISNALRGAWAAVGYHRVRGLSSWADALRRADVDPGADYKKAAGLEGPKEKLADLLDQAIPAVKAMIDSRKKLALFIDPELVDPSWVSKGASFELESAAKQLGKLTAYPYLQIDILPDRPGELDRRRKELEAAGYELLIIRADWPGAWLGTPFSDVVYVRPGQPIPLAMLEAVLFDLLGQWWRQTSQLNGKPLASPILFDAAPYHGVRGLNVEDVRQLIGDRFSV
ncbi:MAG: hypothetical protein HYZ90_01910 [Candidatus Omnitrophica bacterium]|nr:hypothetical protein [Candidatus Omnitrophota bacterium]